MTAPAANSAKTGAGLALGFGLVFADLYGRAGLERLDAIFLAFLEVVDAGLHDRLIDARRDGGPDDRKAQADLLLALVPHVEDFIGDLFNIAAEVWTLQAPHHLAPFHAMKRSFVQRRATKGKTAADAAKIDGPAIARLLGVDWGVGRCRPRARLDHCI